MRRVPRLRQASLLASSPIQCTCAAPATLPISAARRALSTTPATNNRLRKALWKGGEAPGPEDPYSPESSQALRQEALERELAAAEAELATYEADAKNYEAAQRSQGRGRQRPHSKLKVKNPRVWAPTETESEAQGYVPAKTIDGLEEIGGLEGWWEQEGRWGRESQYVGFSNGDKLVDADICEVLVRQAVVEALAVASSKKEQLTVSWARGNQASFDKALRVGLIVREDGSGALEELDSKAVKGVVGPLFAPQPKNAQLSTSYVASETAQELVKSWDPNWKNISLQDAGFKFAVHKRVFQLTGHHVHDAKLAQVNTVADLIATIIKPPKPTKVAEAIRERGELLELPNVRVHDRRVTPIDKETAVGRWKVITEELEKRGLPVTGHEHLGKPVQRKWIQGRT